MESLWCCVETLDNVETLSPIRRRSTSADGRSNAERRNEVCSTGPRARRQGPGTKFQRRASERGLFNMSLTTTQIRLKRPSSSLLVAGFLRPLAGPAKCAVPPHHHHAGCSLAAPFGRHIRRCPIPGPFLAARRNLCEPFWQTRPRYPLFAIQTAR